MATPGNTDRIARRKTIEHGLISKATEPVPIYGSDTFFELEAGCAEFIASIVVAAGCWASRGDTLEEDLRREVEEMSLAYTRLDDEEYRQHAVDHRRTYGRLRVVPARDDLETRVAKARLPRPGDLRLPRPGGRDAG